MSDLNIHQIPISLSYSLEDARTYFEDALRKAQERLVKFAGRYGWESLTAESLADSAEFFDNKTDFDRRVIELCHLDPETKILDTACAGLENRVLIAVAPQLYAKIYPDGLVDGDAAFEKVLTHEMAHHLHIRILEGDEDAMGPIWFFEGFALFAADQFENALVALSDEEIRALIDAKARGSYKKYAPLFRRLVAKAGLPELVAKATEPDFNEWAKSVLLVNG